MNKLILILTSAFAGSVSTVVARAGRGFRARWASRTTRELIAEFQERFGPQSGRLSEDTRLNLIAYILQANGAVAGTERLTPETDRKIGSLLSN